MFGSWQSTWRTGRSTWCGSARSSARALPVGWLSAEEKAAELRRVQRGRAQDTAYEAELIMGWPLTGPRRRSAAGQPRRSQAWLGGG